MTLLGRNTSCSPPVRVEQHPLVELDQLPNQPPERTVRRRTDRREHSTEEFGQIVRAQRESGHHSKAAASAALERPEQVRIGAGIDDPNLAVSRDDLGLEQAGGSHAISLGEAAEATALDQPGDADGQAAATLDIAARLRGDGIIDLVPRCAGPNGHGRPRLIPPSASHRHEGVMKRDGVHRSRPDQQ